jgi:hypothetical protein
MAKIGNKGQSRKVKGGKVFMGGYLGVSLRLEAESLTQRGTPNFIHLISK